MATDKQHERLLAGAEAAQLKLPGTSRPPAPPASVPPVKPMLAHLRDQPPPHSCQQTLTLTYFFDGTGNNLDADVATFEHSNVARLFRSHRLDDDASGLHSFYLAGIGTYFVDREVNDKGGRIDGNAFGALGQQRLDYAFARLRERVAAAEARAENPTNKLCWIKVAVFGFSRGAALARAFCRDLQAKCVEDASSGTGWRLKEGNHPIEITFAGLFDTVASTGLPAGANNVRRNRYAKYLQSMNPFGKAVSVLQTPELKALAFGAPGADPAPGVWDGHGDWADGLAIGKLVKRTVHIMAAHENRNSFPLDTTLLARGVRAVTGGTAEYFSWPDNCTEWLFPGVHSDVGGGYRPGEGGCKPERGAQLSLVALHVMHAQAIEAGVPLVQLSGLTSKEREDFAIDPEGHHHFTAMHALMQHYMSFAATFDVAHATQGLGAQFNQHMRAYYAWRFHAIRRSGDAAKQGTTTEQQEQVTRAEQQFARDRRAIEADLERARRELAQSQQHEDRARLCVESDQLAHQRYGVPRRPELAQEHERAKRDTHNRQVEVDRLRARQDGAADDSKLNASIANYDRMLLDDARAIVAWMREDKSWRLRPHYHALVEAYLDEFERGRGLRDPKVIEFFDEYIHDSLAGFAKDETWPSDPRILYVGGDNKLRYANVANTASKAA